MVHDTVQSGRGKPRRAKDVHLIENSDQREEETATDKPKDDAIFVQLAGELDPKAPGRLAGRRPLGVGVVKVAV
jgi:hypothetical protein